MKHMNLIGWALYGLFAAAVLATGWHTHLFFGGDGPLPWGKPLLWATLLAFLAYSLHASRHENLFATIRVMNGLYWGRQIGTDLYLGLALSLGLIYLHEGSLLVLALYLLPVLAFANLATLLYAAVHYDAIVARFVVG